MSWKDRTGVNNWGFFMTVDASAGILYTTFGSPASDYYGVDRKGNNLFGNSVVAMDANTGKMKWYFQAVHHDIWDFDLPPAPVLMDLTRQWKEDPGLAQTGKIGYVYILNRVTGEAHLRHQGNACRAKQSSWRIHLADAAHSCEAARARPAYLSIMATDLVTAEDTTEAHAKACRELVGKERHALQRRPLHALGLSRTRCSAGFQRHVPRPHRRQRLGRHVRRSQRSATSS